MLLPRSKYQFTFFIKVNWSGSELKLTKVAPVLNQLAIEDGASVDTMLSYYFENLSWNPSEQNSWASMLRLTIWKRQAPYSFFSLKCFTLDSLLKTWLDTQQSGGVSGGIFLPTLFFSNNPFYKRWYLSQFMSLASITWNPEFGYRSSIFLRLNAFLSFKGTLPSYAKRREMLGRKINFRRKLKKKTMEQF